MTTSVAAVPRPPDADGPKYTAEIRHRYQNFAVFTNLSVTVFGYVVTGQLMQLFSPRRPEI